MVIFFYRLDLFDVFFLFLGDSCGEDRCDVGGNLIIWIREIIKGLRKGYFKVI